MSDQLPPNVTLDDITSSLDDAEEFVRRLLGQMHATRRAKGEIVMRLGRTGAGKRPNYRFDQEGTGALVGAVDGATHQPYAAFATTAGAQQWSTASTTYAEVQQVLGQLRGIR